MEQPIITRADASAAGFMRFFTGKPCGKGHVAERYVSSGHCVSCAQEYHGNYGKAYAKTYYAVNRERILEKAREYRIGKFGPPKEKLSGTWYERNRESFLEKCRQRKRELREANPESYRAAERERERKKRLSNPDHYRLKEAAKRHRRRARMRGQESTLTTADLSDLRAKYGKKCAICGVKGKLTIDHIVPIAAGGKHEARNIQFLCGPCNSHKRDLPMEDFARSRGLLI